MDGYIYLVQEREFIKLDDNTFKIGRTKNLMQRMSQYPKGSRLLFNICVQDTIRAESELLAIFQKTFEHVDIGREYFKGDPLHMMEEMFLYLKHVGFHKVTMQEKEKNAQKEKGGQFQTKSQVIQQKKVLNLQPLTIQMGLKS